MVYCKSTGVKVACTLLPYIDFGYGAPPPEGGRAHNEIAPRSCMLRSCRAGKKARREPTRAV